MAVVLGMAGIELGPAGPFEVPGRAQINAAGKHRFGHSPRLAGGRSIGQAGNIGVVTDAKGKVAPGRHRTRPLQLRQTLPGQLGQRRRRPGPPSRQETRIGPAHGRPWPGRPVPDCSGQGLHGGSTAIAGTPVPPPEAVPDGNRRRQDCRIGKGSSGPSSWRPPDSRAQPPGVPAGTAGRPARTGSGRGARAGQPAPASTGDSASQSPTHSQGGKVRTIVRARTTPD